MCLVEIVVLTTKLNSIGYYNYSSLLHNEGIFVCLTALASLVLFIVGLAGYQTNFVQFGLDQLFEAPSHYLGLFVHYAMWTFHLGSMPLIVTIPLLWCDHLKRTAPQVLLTVPFILAFLLIILHTISRWKCNWFYGEPGWPNPYNTVFNVISFARKHKYPLRHSAFTYCDNYLPSRIDFAKERYGGPFSTEQVENVKTFLRILLVLFAMGPVFTLEVPASYFVFPLFSLHTLHYYKYLGKEFCTGVHTWETVVIGSGSLMTILSTLILFPIYIWTTFSTLCKKLKKSFTRMLVGVILCLLGVASLLITDVVGHLLKQSNISNHTQCMFQVHRTRGAISYPALNMHWSVLIPPTLLLRIGPLIVITTILEFISAQSPQSMKGLLVGIFFAIRGLFQFLNSIIIIPFSLKHPWASGEMIENPPVTNCGFVYLLFTCCLLYTSPSPRDATLSRMPSSA